MHSGLRKQGAASSIFSIYLLKVKFYDSTPFQAIVFLVYLDFRTRVRQFI